MKYKVLVFLILIVFGGLVIVNFTKKETKTPYYDLQIEAANKVNTAYDALKEKREELNMPINKDLDPLETGVIGIASPVEGYSITTTLGSLEAKQTSLNPNFVALLINYFINLDLKENESVAVNFSSSFPALNIMTIIALDTLEIDYLIMSSIGASTYGANNIGFTYLKMEEVLFNKGIINKKTEIMSLGGEKDVLAGIWLNDESFIESLYEEYSHIKQIKETDYEKNVLFRFNYYQENLKNIKVFVNVGGNISGMGLTYQEYKNGLISPKRTKINENSGLIDRFLNEGATVVNLLNINDLALKNRLETFSGKPFTIGVGDCYYIYKYEKAVIITTILLVSIVVLLDYEKRTFYKNIKEIFENEKKSYRNI